MQVVLLVAALVILGGVVLAALGRVGEMATFASDTPPMDLDEVSATDVALLRPPMSLWGYNAQATEDALRVIARSVTARDVEIATLRRELADLRGSTGGAQATRTGPVNLPGQPPRAASQPADPLAAYRPPDPAAEAQPAVPVAEAQPAAPAAEAQPAALAAESGAPDPAAEAEPAALATESAAPDPGAETQPVALAAESGPPDPGAEAEPAVPAAESGPPDPGAETQPAGQTPPAEPPGQADKPAEDEQADKSAEDDWLPLWQRSPEPRPDE